MITARVTVEALVANSRLNAGMATATIVEFSGLSAAPSAAAMSTGRERGGVCGATESVRFGAHAVVTKM